MSCEKIKQNICQAAVLLFTFISWVAIAAILGVVQASISNQWNNPMAMCNKNAIMGCIGIGVIMSIIIAIIGMVIMWIIVKCCAYCTCCAKKYFERPSIKYDPYQ